MAPFIYFGHSVGQNTSSVDHNFTSSAVTHTPIINNQHDWQYLSEGASNIIYRYTGSCSHFSGYLLRLRKCLPGTPSTLTLFTTLQNTFLPALGTDIVCPTTLARLAPGVATRFNRSLARWVRRDGKGVGTSVIGTGAVDETEEYAMLVQDMSCGQWALGKGPPLDLAAGEYEMHSASSTGWMDVAMIEFKPRWLAQSADAPSDWNLCRGCALRQMQEHNSVTYTPLQETRMRYHHRRSGSADSGVVMLDEDDYSGEDQGNQGREGYGAEEGEGENEDEDEDEEPYCPLDLSSHNLHRVFRAAKAILHTTAGEVHCANLDIDECTNLDPDTDLNSDSDLPLATAVAEVLLEQFSQWLSPGHHGAEVISRLCRAQEKWGRHGVFVEDEQKMEEVGWAMAVRDCSILVRVWARWIDDGEGSGDRGGKVQTVFECRVADLDVKGGKGGGGVYWKNVERRLEHGGWYEACDGDGTRGCR